jgi:hypothetical protein
MLTLKSLHASAIAVKSLKHVVFLRLTIYDVMSSYREALVHIRPSCAVAQAQKTRASVQSANSSLDSSKAESGTQFAVNSYLTCTSVPPKW